MQNKSTSIILLLALGSLVACQKESTINRTTGETLISMLADTATGNFYFRGTINGAYKDWTVTDYKNGEDLKYRFNAGSAIDTLSSDCKNTFCKFLLDDVVIFENNGPGPTKNYIAAGFNISTKTGDRNEIISQFAAGQKTFGKPRSSISDSVRDGMYVYYIDENGKSWCSFSGSGDQKNSIVISDGLYPQPYPEISCSNIWKVNFSCILYDENGSSLQLKNCEFFTPVLVRR
jgi:hypothetical protein